MSLSSNTQAATGGSLAVVLEVEGCIMATWKNVLIVGWAKTATLELSNRMEAASVDLIRAYPQGISAAHIIVDKTPLPGTEARNRLREITERFAADLACVGTVIDGDGFWASAMRSFLTSLHWLSRRPFKAHYASSIAELVEWMPAPHAQKTGVRIPPADFAKILAEISRRVTKRNVT